MTNQGWGIIGLCMLAAAIVIGLYGIFRSSVTAGVIYLAGSIALFLIFVYLYCTKCPIRSDCVHLVIGRMTRAMPARPSGPYTRAELLGVLLYFAFIAVFPQYWLARDPVLMVVFWVLFAGALALDHFACCKGCGNRYCRMRY